MTQYTRYVSAYWGSNYSKSNSSSAVTPAGIPSGLAATGIHVSSVSISWANAGATRYAIERSTGIGTPANWASIITWTDNLTVTNYTDTGLADCTTYWYRIKSYNSAGIINDIPGNEINVFTRIKAPGTLYGNAVSTDSINWRWLDNSVGETGYSVYSSTGGLFANLSANVTFWVETGLQANTQYIRYASAYNSNDSANSNVVPRYTLANMPTGVTATAVNTTSSTIIWDNVGATTYWIDRSTGFAAPVNWIVLNCECIGIGYVDSLSPETTYWYRIRSLNGDVVVNPVYDTISIITKIAPPSPFYGTALSGTEMYWGWQDNSNIETGYYIYSIGDILDQTLPANTTFWIETGLQANTQHTRYASVYNLTDSAISNVVTRYTLLETPPANLDVNSVFTTSATINWTNDATRYAIERSTGILTPSSYTFIVTFANNITGYEYTNTGLSAETTYWYRVKGYNGDAVINDTPSNEVNLLTLPAAPSSFGYQTVLSTAILWKWTSNSAYEKGFRIKSSIGAPVIDLPAGATYWLETAGINPNTQYSRYAVAYNATGESFISNISAVYTLAAVPTGLAVSSVGLSSATITWNNAGATRYSIERSTGSDGPENWQCIRDWSNNITGTTFYDNTFLLRGTTYWYRVKSYNVSSTINEVPSSQLKVITEPNHAPVLTWLNETGFTTDGLDPEAGPSNTRFFYRIKYTDPDDDPPAADYPKVHILYNSVEIATGTMTRYSNDRYHYVQLLPRATGYTYYFEAYDSFNNAPAESFISGTGPEVLNSKPALAWTGELNYTDKGLYPAHGNPNLQGVQFATFTYHIKYSDYEGDAPKTNYPRLHILKNNIEIPGSPFTMSLLSGSYGTGALYSYSIAFSTTGTDFSYYFDAFDIYDSSAPSAGAIKNGPDVNSVPYFDYFEYSGSSTTANVVNRGQVLNFSARAAWDYASQLCTDYRWVKFGWDWNGDLAVDEWSSYIESGGSASEIAHSWSSTGTYTVRAQAQDRAGLTSDWSIPLTYSVIYINKNPSTPVLSGPTSAIANTSYTYTATATDPENDQIKFGWDWDNDGQVDEWSDFGISGRTRGNSSGLNRDILISVLKQ